MTIKDKIKKILIGIFYDDAGEILDEAYEKVQSSDRRLIKLLGFLFVVNTMIIMILFFTGHFTVYNFFEMGLLVITIVAGLFAWLLGVINNQFR